MERRNQYCMVFRHAFSVLKGWATSFVVKYIICESDSTSVYVQWVLAIRPGLARMEA